MGEHYFILTTMIILVSSSDNTHTIKSTDANTLVYNELTTDRPALTWWFFWTEPFVDRFAAKAGDGFRIGISKSSSVRSITVQSLNTAPVLLGACRSVTDKQPLISGGLPASVLELLETTDAKSGKGPWKNFSNVTDDRSYFLMTCSC